MESAKELLKLESSPVISIATWDIFSQIKESFDRMDGYSSNEVVSIFVHTPREDLKTRMIKQGEQKKKFVLVLIVQILITQ
ncbi:hypothetical protein C2I27_04485 [Priestia megaterium]|uniref:hypothetical protein n=1 Tax=Priestia megaterium TaxID=1404 RepID=UPI000D51294E|nr:hypothetical protein [Priestia megaterium]PVC75149.1 hypothetical protein C2I27_04485 [Priestia megaterium]